MEIESNNGSNLNRISIWKEQLFKVIKWNYNRLRRFFSILLINILSSKFQELDSLKLVISFSSKRVYGVLFRLYLLTSITAFTWAAMPEKYGMIDRMDFRLRHENTLQCENREVKRVKRNVKNGCSRRVDFMCYASCSWITSSIDTSVRDGCPNEITMLVKGFIRGAEAADQQKG